MRTGPFGRREAHISRFIEGFPSGFLRPAFIDPMGRERVLNRRARPARLRNPTRNSSSDSPPLLNLKCALPINLHEFLAEQFAGDRLSDGLRIDEDGVFTLGQGAGEDTLSRVARAIRRYSTQRAHERWDECATALAGLTDDLDWAAESGEQVALCLGCAGLEDRRRRHRASSSGWMRRGGAERADRQLRRGAERAARSAAARDRGLPSGPRGALACRMMISIVTSARGQVIFTWRPLSA